MVKKRTAVFIDSCVWDFLFDRGIDISKELPKGQFILCITKEAKFEIRLLPSPIKEYALKTINERVETKSYFGFLDLRYAEGEQRSSGFGSVFDMTVGGEFSSVEEEKFREQLESRHLKDRMRPTGLKENEADISLATRSIHSVILTLDKDGPMKTADKEWGNIVCLNDFDEIGLPLGAFIISKMIAGRVPGTLTTETGED